jgi:uncharacterized small protein (DUF1192 family)
MIKTLEERVQTLIGAQTLRICQLEAEVELLHAKLKELDAAKPAAVPPAESV